MTLSSVLKTLSVTTVAMTAAVSTIAPAQALNLNGSVSLSGNAQVPNGQNPASTTINFTSVTVDDLVGDFGDVLTPPLPVISNLTLNRTVITDNIGPDFSANYEISGPIANFINFGTQTIDGVTSQLTFDLLSAEFSRNSFGNPAQFVSLNPTNLLNGVFQFNGETVANGFLSASLSGAGDSYQITLSTDPVDVPEPFTILGSLSALGVGTVMKKQHDKRQNKA